MYVYIYKINQPTFLCHSEKGHLSDINRILALSTD